MKIQIPDYIQVLIDLLNQNGYSAYVVGGAIRNALLELPIHDYDLTTDATPEKMLQVFSNYVYSKQVFSMAPLLYCLINNLLKLLRSVVKIATKIIAIHLESHSLRVSRRIVNVVILQSTLFAITTMKV